MAEINGTHQTVTDLHERAARAEKHEMAQRRRVELVEAQLAETQALLRASEERANGLSEQVSQHPAPLVVWSLFQRQPSGWATASSLSLRVC
jgi:hypothetical protein